MQTSELTNLKWWYAATENGYVAGAGDKELTKELSKEDACLISQAPELFVCVLSMLRWYSNRLDGHNISPIQNQPPEIQRAMRVYKTITGEDYV